ncbi:hypothetical protein K438DRAFT_1973138 [Mycena galopus ATCC 62051]|nr:hypothetical protein K438DRAFT_1973138 [Mycena galopus ATCC 62051]
MDRPRAHSVMQMRAPTQSAFQVRASKLFQKVSAKFARAPPDSHSSNRDSSTNDANNMNSPYMRRGTYSMDGAVAKPYMSQPMLGLMLTRHVEDPDPDAGAEESDGSGSGSERGGVLGLPVGSVNMGMTLNSRRSDGNIVLHPAAPPRPSRAVPPPPPSNASSPPPLPTPRLQY